MREKTRYQYERRIKELERQVENLRPYRLLSTEIYLTLCDLYGQNKQVSMAWLLKQYKVVFK